MGHGEGNVMMGIIRKKLKSFLRFVFPFLTFLAVWSIASPLVPSNLLPSPFQVFLTFTKSLSSGLLIQHLSKSLYRLLVGYLIGVGVGIGTGIVLGSNKYLHKTFSPILSLLISIPTVAWVPVLLVITGLGDKTIILSIFLGSFFAIVYNTMDGVRRVENEMIDSAKITGASKPRVFLEVLFPASLVSIIPGLRLGIGYSWRALVGGEMLASREMGLGKLIYGARSFGGVEEMIVSLALIGLLAFLMDRLLISELEERTIVRWGMVKK